MTLDQIFREGLEAALKADPHAVSRTTPSTVLGAAIRALALDCARGKVSAIRLALSLVSNAGEPANEAETRPEPEWEWQGGVWRSPPAEPPGEAPAEFPWCREKSREKFPRVPNRETAYADTEALRARLKARFLRADDGEPEDVGGAADARAGPGPP